MSVNPRRLANMAKADPASDEEDDGPKEGQSLHENVELGRLDLIKAFVEKEKLRGTTVQLLLEERDLVMHATALHFAAEFGRTEIAQYLCDNNIRVDITDHAGATPMHLAAGCGHTQIIKVLNDAGAKTSLRDRDGNTPLHWACTKGQFDCVKILISFGAALDLQNEEGWTPLHRACFNGRNDIVELMVDRGASLHTVTKRGDTHLHLAAAMNRIDTLELLIDRGANPSIVNVDNKTPAEMTINEGVIAMLSEALERQRSGANRKKEARGLLKQETFNPNDIIKLASGGGSGSPAVKKAPSVKMEEKDVFRNLANQGKASEEFPGLESTPTKAAKPEDRKDGDAVTLMDRSAEPREGATSLVLDGLKGFGISSSPPPKAPSPPPAAPGALSLGAAGAPAPRTTARPGAPGAAPAARTSAAGISAPRTSGSSGSGPVGGSRTSGSGTPAAPAARAAAPAAGAPRTSNPGVLGGGARPSVTGLAKR